MKKALVSIVSVLLVGLFVFAGCTSSNGGSSASASADAKASTEASEEAAE